MYRRELLQATLAGAVSAQAAPPPLRFAHVGKTLRQLQAEMASGALTAAELCRAYLGRIEALNLRGPALRAVLETNRQALDIAQALDAERKAKGPRGPLHGIPVLLKDNIDTGDYQQTTAGSLALLGVMTRGDATLVRRLREAGALILGKANLSEWANFRSETSLSGWSARGGQGRNPYALDRSPIGSSSGCASAVAADLCAVAVGTETDGSLVAPASAQAVVALKPTVGLVSRRGLIPLSASQDTAGPMARCVEDAALLLDALAGEDPGDAATQGSAAREAGSYTRLLTEGALRGARLGVARALVGQDTSVARAFEAALDDLKHLGAELVELEKLAPPPELGDAELLVLLAEFKDGLDAYLAARVGTGTGPRSLADLVAFNQRHAAQELPWFGQDLFEKALASGGRSPASEAARARCLALSRDGGLGAALTTHHLDAVVAPTFGPAWLVDPLLGDPSSSSASTFAAVAGTPSLTVPMGAPLGLPLGLLFCGPAWSEARLLALGFAYETATRHRKAPTFPATLRRPGW